jgi:hypothetical protein
MFTMVSSSHWRASSGYFSLANSSAFKIENPLLRPMVKTRIGKLAPRYSFMLNPHTEVRLSKCPKCRKATHLRQFALFVHIDEWGTDGAWQDVSLLFPLCDGDGAAG